jgi:hypothetical protein
MRILIIVLIASLSYGQDIKLKIDKSTKIILKPDRTWNLDKRVEIKTKDGKVAIINPDNTWEYKDTFGKNKDVLILQNGTKYEGKFKFKDDKGVTFHVDGMPAAQKLPMSMVNSVTLLNGNVLVNNSKDENYSRQVKASNAKTQDTDDDDIISYKQLIDLEAGKNISNWKSYNIYETKDGSKISLGDTLIFGKPFGDNERFDEILGNSYKGFTYVSDGNAGFGALFSKSMPLLPEKFQNTEIIVKKINIYYSKVFKKSKMLLRMIVRDPNEMGGYRTIWDFERAISTGELINPKAPLTKEQAIKKLKSFKELLDLEIIAKEEYDKHKLELTPLIIGK